MSRKNIPERKCSKAEAPKRKRGGQTTYTPELGQRICDELATGKSLNEICKAPGMPAESVVRNWVILDVGGIAAKYAHARDISLDCQADAMLAVARDKTRDARCRQVEIDALKWRLCKMAPKRYGDKLEHEVSGPNGGPVQASITIQFVEPPKKA